MKRNTNKDHGLPNFTGVTLDPDITKRGIRRKNNLELLVLVDTLKSNAL